MKEQLPPGDPRNVVNDPRITQDERNRSYDPRAPRAKTRRTPLVGRIRLPATPKSRARIRLALLLRTRRTDKSSRSPPIGTIRTPRIASLSRTDRRRTPSRLIKRIPTTKTRRMRRVRSSTRTRLRPSKRGQKTPRMARRTRRMPAPRPSGRIRRSKGKPIGKPPSPIARRPRTRPPAREGRDQEDRRREEDWQGLHHPPEP